MTRPARQAATGIDRLAVAMLTVAAFLVVLALLAWQVRAKTTGHAGRLIVVRRIYQTRVVETLVGPSNRHASVSQSVSSTPPSPAPAPAPAPTPAATRSS